MIVRHLCLTCVACCNFACVNGQPSIEAVNRALDIAERAAAGDLTELSMRAVTQSLSHGIPTVSESHESGSIQHWGARVDTSKPLPPTAQEAIRLRIPGTLRRLTNSWKSRASPSEIYNALRDVVMPVDRPFATFLYGNTMSIDPLHPDRFVEVNHLGNLLIQWAIRADALDVLAKHILSRELDSSIERHALSLIVATHVEDVDLIKDLQNRTGVANIKATPRQIEILASAAWLCSQDARLLPTASRTFRQTGQWISSSSDKSEFTPEGAILLAGARCQFAAQQQSFAIESLKWYLNRAPQHRTEHRGGKQRIDVVARELFSRGLVAEASSILPEDVAKRYQRRYQVSDSRSISSPAGTTDSGSTRRLPRILLPDRQPLEDQQIWICELDPNTEGSRVLFALPDFQHVSSPAVSPDESQIAFDATFPGEPITSAGRVYVVALDGSQISCPGSGTLPSWSPKGRRITYSGYSPSRGVWAMRSDGTEAQLIDAGGWSGRWSPNGRMIAYSRYENRRPSLVVFDIVENEFFEAWGLRKTSVSSIMPNFEWSSDSRSIIMQVGDPVKDGRRSRIIRANVLTAGVDLLAELDVETGGDLAVNSRDQVACVAKLAGPGSEKLCLVDEESVSLLQPIAGQFRDRRNTAVAWWPNSGKLIYVSKPGRK